MTHGEHALEWRTYTCACRSCGVSIITYARHDAMQARSMSARHDGVAMSGPADGGFSNGDRTRLHQTYDKCISHEVRCSASSCVESIVLVKLLMQQRRKLY